MITSLKFKKYQRKINKIARNVNSEILKDSLWKGRFQVRQVYESHHAYEDKSGLQAFFVFEFKDLRTGQTKLYHYDWISFQHPFNAYPMFYDMNNFIVEVCDIWNKDKPNPRDDTTIYRKR